MATPQTAATSAGTEASTPTHSPSSALHPVLSSSEASGSDHNTVTGPRNMGFNELFFVLRQWLFHARYPSSILRGLHVSKLLVEKYYFTPLYFNPLPPSLLYAAAVMMDPSNVHSRVRTTSNWVHNFLGVVAFIRSTRCYLCLLHKLLGLPHSGTTNYRTVQTVAVDTIQLCSAHDASNYCGVCLSAFRCTQPEHGGAAFQERVSGEEVRNEEEVQDEDVQSGEGGQDGGIRDESKRLFKGKGADKYFRPNQDHKSWPSVEATCRECRYARLWRAVLDELDLDLDDPNPIYEIVKRDFVEKGLGTVELWIKFLRRYEQYDGPGSDWTENHVEPPPWVLTAMCSLIPTETTLHPSEDFTRHVEAAIAGTPTSSSPLWTVYPGAAKAYEHRISDMLTSVFEDGTAPRQFSDYAIELLTPGEILLLLNIEKDVLKSFQECIKSKPPAEGDSDGRRSRLSLPAQSPSRARMRETLFMILYRKKVLDSSCCTCHVCARFWSDLFFAEEKRRLSQLAQDRASSEEPQWEEFETASQASDDSYSSACKRDRDEDEDEDEPVSPPPSKKAKTNLGTEAVEEISHGLDECGGDEQSSDGNDSRHDSDDHAPSRFSVPPAGSSRTSYSPPIPASPGKPTDAEEKGSPSVLPVVSEIGTASVPSPPERGDFGSVILPSSSEQLTKAYSESRSEEACAELQPIPMDAHPIAGRSRKRAREDENEAHSSPSPKKSRPNPGPLH